MKNSEVCTEICKVFPRYKEVLKHVGVVDLKIKPSSKATKEKLIYAYLWLVDLEYDAEIFMSVYNLRTPEMWRGYKNLELTHRRQIAEWNLYVNALEVFTHIWKSRPGVLRRLVYDKPEVCPED